MDQRRDPIEGVFADFAGRFGLSRPAGQCFAAIWRAAAAPCADDLVARLGLSRSNVSTALKELRLWGLVTVLRAPGDRKEYFAAPGDPWQILGLLLAERARRDIAPARDRLAALDGDARAAVALPLAGRPCRASGRPHRSQASPGVASPERWQPLTWTASLQAMPGHAAHTLPAFRSSGSTLQLLSLKREATAHRPAT